MSTEEKFLNTHSEKFLVRVIHTYYFPIAIIETLNPVKQNDPSKGVQIVREFLKRELSSEKSPYIKFEFIGPSPFHLDCFISPHENEDDSFWLINTEEIIERGYDTLIFFYNSKEIKESDEALEYIMDSIEDEFGFYYKYVQLRVEKMYSWEKIEDSLKDLQNIQNSKGIRGFFSRLFKRQALIGKLFSELATFEAREIYLNSIRQNEYNEVYKAKDELYFKNFIDKEREEKYVYPVKQVTELVKFYEGRRVKSVELIIAIVAAILGGTIGTMLTIYLQTGKN